MKKSDDILENLLRDSYEGYAVPEFKNSWAKIHSKVAKHNFFKLSLNSFNVYYTALIISSVITGSVLLYNNAESQETVAQEGIPVENLQITNPESQKGVITVLSDETADQDTVCENIKTEPTIKEKIIDDSNLKGTAASPHVNNKEKESSVSFSEQKTKQDDMMSSPVVTAETNNSTTAHETVVDSSTPIKQVRKVYVEQPKIVVKDTVITTVKTKKRRKGNR